MSGFPFFSRDNANTGIPKIKHHYLEPSVLDRLAVSLCQHLKVIDPTRSRPLVVVGIGTDRSTGDSLGPLVGTKLVAAAPPGLHVYGTLDEPVHASNLNGKLEEIRRLHHNPLIIAIDACLGQVESIGSVTLAAGAVKPGAGVHKNLPPVGEIHFTGIVNVGGYMEYFVLQNTRLSLVMRMADLIAQAILDGYQMVFTTTPRREAMMGSLQ